MKELYKAGCLRDSLLRVSKTWASEKVHEKHYFISLEVLLLPLRWHYWYLLGGASGASLGSYLLPKSRGEEGLRSCLSSTLFEALRLLSGVR